MDGRLAASSARVGPTSTEHCEAGAASSAQVASASIHHYELNLACKASTTDTMLLSRSDVP
jgi:hypothetical protein